MRFDLAAQFRRLRNPRRRVVTLPSITVPATYATDLYATYRPVVQAWESALPGIIAEYERTLAQMTTDAPADVAVKIEQVERDLAIVFLTVRMRLERWAAIVEAFHRRRWRGAVLSATGIDLQTMIGPADARETLANAIERNASLVKSVSEQARQRIADAVFRGFQRRAAADEIGRELREAVGMARRRARNIAADQTVKLGAALNEERRRQAGISAWEWVHSAKLHPREEHKARNGLLYSDDPADLGVEEGGKRVRKPPQDRPGELPYCGCTSRAVLILA